MAMKARRPGKTGKARREVPGTVKAARSEAAIASEARWFINDYGHGGIPPAAVRSEYAALLRKARPHERRYAGELRAARAAYGEALARPFTPFPAGERRGLRLEGGGIQWPEAEALGVEVYDRAGALVGVVEGKAVAKRGGFTKAQARTVNEYLRLAGARVA
ncbi:MAG: hypothetical protein IIZ06_03650 [Kiritimatiellae bacterium]|nr:hypothetical protein [Kiritimatiellia bacterium]